MKIKLKDLMKKSFAKIIANDFFVLSILKILLFNNPRWISEENCKEYNNQSSN